MKSINEVVDRSKMDGSDNIIRFNMQDEEKIRNVARQGYQVAKNLKESGLKFKKVIPASTDATVRKLFKLPPDSDLICLEIDVHNKTENQKMLAIEEIKNNFLLLENFKLITESPYVYDKTNTVYRFLFKYGPNAQK